MSSRLPIWHPARILAGIPDEQAGCPADLAAIAQRDAVVRAALHSVTIRPSRGLPEEVVGRCPLLTCEVGTQRDVAVVWCVPESRVLIAVLVVTRRPPEPVWYAAGIVRRHLDLAAWSVLRRDTTEPRW